MNDTIVARATGAGRGAIAILRLSGPQTGTYLAALAGPLPPARAVAVRTLRGDTGELIDEAVVLWMPGPASFTGEDCAELHVHGGPAVIEAVTGALLRLGGRPAEPGEFSRRAFTHGKLDLLQAEAVADLVDAETEAQRRQALGQLTGRTSRVYRDWRERLIRAMALVEAEIDFPDEDIPGAVAQQALPELLVLIDELEDALANADRGQQVREGYRIAVIGATNAGKSSLFNALVQREAAIVSSRPGTTRDIIEIQWLIDGFQVVLADTAGMRATTDEIEAEGVRRAEAWASAAALRLLLVEPGAGANAVGPLLQPGDILVLTKADLPSPDTASALMQSDLATGGTVSVSSVTGAGLNALRAAIGTQVRLALGAAEQATVTRARHESAIRQAIALIRSASAELSTAPDRAAEDLRLAAGALKSVVGDVDRESVLDQVFSTFCIGK